MIKITLAAAALVFAAPFALAEETAPAEMTMSGGPVIGELAPTFAAITSAGEAVDFAAISGANGAVIVFSRSLDWCPYCKKQALELEGVADELAAAGWDLSLITYDSPETLTAFGTEKSLTYTLLSDMDSAMVDAFNLRNTEVTPGSRFDGIPYPAIVFISADGMVRGIQKEDGYKIRPPVEGLVQFVTELNNLTVPLTDRIVAQPADN